MSSSYFHWQNVPQVYNLNRKIVFIIKGYGSARYLTEKFYDITLFYLLPTKLHFD